jgi:hypothetical protein
MEKKRKIFQAPEERAAWEARHEESTRRLQYYIDRAQAELEAEGEPLHDLQYYIARAQAEPESASELPLA